MNRRVGAPLPGKRQKKPAITNDDGFLVLRVNRREGAFCYINVLKVDLLCQWPFRVSRSYLCHIFKDLSLFDLLQLKHVPAG
jgi:hypothetical protein